ncbi:mediator of RNA polymerase II transcription subunit 12-like protein [Pollicipes pollicipes]|uniref:mediator of RNA polymerase II transcription subunit 12-like protein n=1 Tax=Pollicipes pollicipes TaxID=41117 RepID=UPI0018857478|nr:mediator of RNA polymerase II transcription subunit 12-like protein [Pollicipes pollicipes]
MTAPATHRSVALFMTVLAARHCIYMDDVIQFGAHCLLTGSKGDREREPGARLVLRLLGHLWIPSEQPQPTWYDTGSSTSVPSAGQPCSLKYSCDRHLLLAAQDNIPVQALLCALKTIIILADATIGDGVGRTESKTGGGELSISAILGTSDHHGEPNEHGRSGPGLSKAGLSEFARHMLKQICSQSWVREKFLSSPEEIVSMEKANSPDEVDVDLLDREMSPKQARRLFHMIVHPDNYTFFVDDTPGERQVCGRILETLDQWTMRVALLDLRLLYRQTAKQAADKHAQWLQTLARAVIEAFQLGGGEAHRPHASLGSDERPSFVWLVPPLVAKLPAEAQARILQAAIQPFKQLVLSCVRGHEEQRDELVSSLQVQFQQFLSRDGKDKETVFPDENKTGPHVYSALQLRFSLLGGVFDAIQRGSLSCTDTWVVLLAQLVTNGVVTLYNNSDMHHGDRLDLLGI